MEAVADLGRVRAAVNEAALDSSRGGARRWNALPPRPVRTAHRFSA